MRYFVETSPQLQEEYIKIYFSYHFLKWPWYEIYKKFNCKKTKVYEAIKWVEKNGVQLPAKSLLQGAIFTTQERLKGNTELWEREHNRNQPSIRNISELSRELREDSKLLYQLQNLYAERYEVELKGDQPLTSAQVLKIIQGKDSNA